MPEPCRRRLFSSGATEGAVAVLLAGDAFKRPIQLQFPFYQRLTIQHVQRTAQRRRRATSESTTAQLKPRELYSQPRRALRQSTATPSTTPLQRTLSGWRADRSMMRILWNGSTKQQSRGELLVARPALPNGVFTDRERELLIPVDSIVLLRTGQLIRTLSGDRASRSH
jgi:hypothetical protein